MEEAVTDAFNDMTLGPHPSATTTCQISGGNNPAVVKIDGDDDDEADDDGQNMESPAAAALLQNFEEIERELLSRTIFVTDVEGLQKKENVRALESFFNDLSRERHLKDERRRNKSKNMNNNKQQQKQTKEQHSRPQKKWGVEYCWVTGYNDQMPDMLRRDPPARVRFWNKIDAERLFGIRDDNDSGNFGIVGLVRTCRLPCSLGTFVDEKNKNSQKCITIRPSFAYRGMLRLEQIDTVIEIPTVGLSLGHWFPAEQDAYTKILRQQQQQEDHQSSSSTSHESGEATTALLNHHPDLWLEEITTDLKPTLRFDLRDRRLELRVPRQEDDKGKSEFSDIQDYLTIRFHKAGKLELVCLAESSDGVNINPHHYHQERATQHYDEQHQYALVFSLRHPPEIESETPIRGLGLALPETMRNRCIRFDNILAEEFGRCLGYKLLIDQEKLQQLLGSESNSNERGLLPKLQDFGLFRRDFMSLQQARKITVQQVPQNDDVEHVLTFVHDSYPRAGFLLRSMLDNGIMSVQHAMNDTVNELTIFYLILTAEGIMEDVQSYRTHYDTNSVNHAAGTSPVEWKVVRTLQKMMRRASRTRYPARMFHRLLTQDNFDIPEPPMPEHCFAITRVLLTPTRVAAVQGFEPELSNSVVRFFLHEYGEHFNIHDSFIRVQVAEEDGQKLFHGAFTESVVKKLKSVVVKGISINGRRYHYFGQSSSQLKESSFWMVRLPGQDWTVHGMRSMLGDFTACKSISLLAARWGQRFSSTFQTSKAGHHRDHDDPGGGAASIFSGSDGIVLEDTPLRHEIIDDIESSHNDRRMCHSDGIGIMSHAARDKIVSGLPDPPRDVDDVSAIQIRYGGAKGVLLLDTTGMCRDYNVDILLRKSMIKFDAPYKHIGVCAIARHAPYFLNRNVILILMAHGVQAEVFIRMQEEMLRDLDCMLKEREKAMELIPRLGGSDETMKTTLLDMLGLGLSPAFDPFLLSCVHAIRTHRLYGLRKKARIFVRDGAVLMGGIDETMLLPEGTVFLQIRKESTDETSPFVRIVGPVLVTKHPVMHPGDVRMLLAIDLPELREIRNTLVFSQKGSRPEPSKMAGSDLDGDEYAVTWDRRLFLNEWNNCTIEGNTAKTTRMRSSTTSINFSNVKHAARVLSRANAVPLDYLRPPKPDTPESIDDEKLNTLLVDHFFEYNRHDVLGLIGMLWQDYAARSGAGCYKCTQLAELHSMAVDYAKTGVPAVVPRELKLSGRCPRAHWREKKHVPSFRCNSIIGRLYDEVVVAITRSERALTEDITETPYSLAGRKIGNYGQILSFLAPGQELLPNLAKVYNPGVVMLLDTKQDGSLQSFARKERRSYDSQLATMMNSHGILSEGEVFTGCIHIYHKKNMKRQHEVSLQVLSECRNIRVLHRDRFFREVTRICLIGASKKERQKTNLTTELTASFMGEATVSTADSSSADEDRGGNDMNDEESVLAWIREVTTGATDMPYHPLLRADLARRTANELAASYYMETYDPNSRWIEDNGGQVFFSFPWVVSDVIAFGMLPKPDASTRPPL